MSQHAHYARTCPYVFPNLIVTRTGVRRVGNQPSVTRHVHTNDLYIPESKCTENVHRFIFIVIWAFSGVQESFIVEVASILSEFKETHEALQVGLAFMGCDDYHCVLYFTFDCLTFKSSVYLLEHYDNDVLKY